MNNKETNGTKIVVLGGLGEVGKNMYCIMHNDAIIIIDAGVRFPDNEIMGVDYILPDFTFLKENEEGNLDDYVNCNICGKMIIPDTISLEECFYEYSINYDDFIEENCKKNENTLDIFQFLWENIVLEVPLRFTKVRDLSKFHGDGWKLVSEDELNKSNNPFSDLLKDFEEE